MKPAQWPQDIVVRPMEEPSLERKVRPQANCPRCNSTNTKFCYYNNYSLSQPRFFCKTCRRYWTEGGTLRNIPVGGGSRKHKKSSSTSSSSSKKIQDPLSSSIPILQNPNSILSGPQDLNLGFSSSTPHDHFRTINELIQVPNFEKHSSSPSTSANFELLTSGIGTTTTTTSRGLMSSFMSMPLMTTNDSNNVYSSSSSGFPILPLFKPSLNFSLDGLGSNYGSFQGVQETNGKLLFPFADLNQVSTNTKIDADDQNREQHGDSTAGYWNGVIGGGSW